MKEERIMARNHERQTLYDDILNSFNNNLDNLHQDNDILKMCINYALLTVACDEIVTLYGMPILSNEDELVLILPVVDGEMFQTVTNQGNYFNYSESAVVEYFLFKYRNEERVLSIFRFDISSSINTYKSKACFHGRELSFQAKKSYITDA